MRARHDKIYEIVLEDVEVDNVPLAVEPKDFRAKHCKTARELALFKFSSNYQTIKGGLNDLQAEIGIDIDVDNLDVI